MCMHPSIQRPGAHAFLMQGMYRDQPTVMQVSPTKASDARTVAWYLAQADALVPCFEPSLHHFDCNRLAAAPIDGLPHGPVGSIAQLPL